MNDMQLQAFLAAASSLTFSAAAEQLFLPPQTVSKYIQNLEHDLDVALFDRSGGRLELTEAGRMYQALFLDSLAGLNRLGEDSAETIRRLRGSLRLGISSWLSLRSPLGDAIAAYGRQTPGLALSMRVMDNIDLRRAFEGGDLDIAILSSDFYRASGDTESDVLAPEDLCLYAPDWVEGDAIDPACWGLPYLQCAAWEWSYLEWKHIGHSMLDESALKPRHLVLLPNTETVRSEMRVGRCVAVTDRFFGILRDIPGLRRFPMHITPDVICVWMKYNESPLIPEFTAFVRAYFAPGGPGRSSLTDE